MRVAATLEKPAHRSDTTSPQSSVAPIDPVCTLPAQLFSWNFPGIMSCFVLVMGLCRVADLNLDVGLGFLDSRDYARMPWYSLVMAPNLKRKGKRPLLYMSYNLNF